MAPCTHSTIQTLQRKMKFSCDFAIWQHCLTFSVKSCVEERIIVISVCLNCGAQGESVTPVGFDILCSELLSVVSRRQSISAATKRICWHMGKDSTGAGVQGQGLVRRYYWISVVTFNLLLWGRFPQNRLFWGLHPGLVGHNHPHRQRGVMERQHMVNIHVKSPVRQTHSTD